MNELIIKIDGYQFKINIDITKTQDIFQDIPKPILFVKIEYALNHIEEIIWCAPKEIKHTNDKIAYVLKCSASYIKIVKKILKDKETNSNIIQELRNGTKTINEISKFLRKKNHE